MQKAQSGSLTLGNRERHCNITFTSATPGSFFNSSLTLFADQQSHKVYRASSPVSSQCRCAIGADKTYDVQHRVSEGKKQNRQSRAKSQP